MTGNMLVCLLLSALSYVIGYVQGRDSHDDGQEEGQ